MDELPHQQTNLSPSASYQSKTLTDLFFLHLFLYELYQSFSRLVSSLKQLKLHSLGSCIPILHQPFSPLFFYENFYLFCLIPAVSGLDVVTVRLKIHNILVYFSQDPVALKQDTKY